MKIQINFVSSFGARNSTNSPRFARGVVVQANPFKNRGSSVGGVRPCTFNGGQDKCLGKAFAAAMGTSGSVIPLPPVFACVKEESEDCRAVALATADDLRDVRRANRDP